MAKTIKLFVGGLPPTVTKQELEHVFREFGASLKIDLQLKQGSYLNQGYAFLLVTDPAIADRIVESEFEIRHRRLQVQYSKKVPKKQNVAPLRLYCRGIPPDVGDEELTRFFNEFVECRAAYSIKNSHGKKKGYGFIELLKKESAQTLLDIRTFKLGDTHLVVEEFSRLIRSKPQAIPDHNARGPQGMEKTENLYQVSIAEYPLKYQAQIIHRKHNPNYASSQNEIYDNSSISSRAVIWKGSGDNLNSRARITNQIIMEQHSLPKKVDSWELSSAELKINKELTPKYGITLPALHHISWLRIGNSTWMQSHPMADIMASARHQQHELANMRFNILTKLLPETSQK